MSQPANGEGPLETHAARAQHFRELAEALEKRARRISLLRLIAFVDAIAFLVSGFRSASSWQCGVGGAIAVGFVALVVAHSRLAERLADAEIRRDLHLRHVDRVTGAWTKHAFSSSACLPHDHPYARDIDLVGEGSLVQRIDVTQTERGIRALCGFLGAPAQALEVKRRQAAVGELARAVEFRESLEAAGLSSRGSGKLDVAPFLAFVEREPLIRSGAARAAVRISPVVFIALFTLGAVGVVPHAVWAAYLTVQSLVAVAFARRCHDVFDLLAARRGYVEAFRRMLVAVDGARFEAELLEALRARVAIGGVPPLRYLGALDRYAGLAEFRSQFPIHLVLNFLLLWDLNVLERLEAWNARTGKGMEDVLDALGEIEALSALGCFAFVERGSTFPDIAEPGGAFVAEDLAHPLLPAERRVANSLSLRGASSALVVTGSNMAGKSTLLRAVGLNIALALAGGPVIARRLSIPPVRLRASMRIDDDLQRGASYFHAELMKLKSVVDEADASPPVFFLLDELLRGTNARARHLGGRAVLAHLLSRGAMGIAATHDIALAELEAEHPGLVRNFHFTDVMDDGEMMFDYRLREGVVRTSNALHLLAMAGIEVPSDA